MIIALTSRLIPLSGQDAVPDSLTAGQFQEIEKLLDRDRANALHWWYGWLTGYSTATIGQGIVYFSSDNKETRQDMALGSATTLLGAIGQLITPLVPGNSSLNDTGNPEEMLKEIARREKEGRSWKMHLITGVVNAGSGLITWLGFKRTVWDGLGNFALNTVITETQIWTQPTRAVKDYQNYCKKYKSGSIPETSNPEKEWIVRTYPGGITIEVNF